MSEPEKLYHPVSIGDLRVPGNLFLAPVAGYSDRAFRSICVENGAAFTYTEMVSAEALVRESGKTHALMSRAPNETAYAVQLFGGAPERVAEAARIVYETTDAECIDINAGCPVPKICKTGAGSSLTRDPERLFAITQATVRAIREAERERPESLRAQPMPITVKIRSGWDDATAWQAAADAAIAAGAAAVTLHPRTRSQGYEGTANWSLIAQLTAHARSAAPQIPIFGSGDLFSPEAARDMLKETGCDGVMFARGAMGNPFIFAQTRALLENGEYAEIPADIRLAAGWNELALLVKDAGERTACREMRKRFCAYSKGIDGGATLRTELVKAETIADYREIFVRRGLSFSEGSA